MSRTPLFDVMFALHNNAQAGKSRNGLSGLSVSFEVEPGQYAKLDIACYLQITPAE